MHRRHASLVVFLLVALLSANGTASLGREVPAPSEGTTRLLLRLGDETSAAEPPAAVATGTSARPSLTRLGRMVARELEGRGGRVVRTYRWQPFVAVEIPEARRDEVRSIAGVAAIHPDLPLAPSLDRSVAQIGALVPLESGLQLSGTGWSVAVIDTGWT
jgi:hypothetical protein